MPADNIQKTIVLLKDISENVTIVENQNIVLNLSNYTITNKNSSSAIITLSGILTIKNGTVTGLYNAKYPTILVNANSKLNLSNSVIDRNSSTSDEWETIQLYGDLNMDSGKINSPNTNAICTYANYNSNIIISGGTITSSYSGNANSATIVNGTSGTMTISGGTITSTTNCAIQNKGILEISQNAYINSGSSDVGSATLCGYGGTITLNGGKIENTANGYAIWKSYGTITNNGCEVIGSSNI